jgi:hypothetical protein
MGRYDAFAPWRARGWRLFYGSSHGRYLAYKPATKHNVSGDTMEVILKSLKTTAAADGKGVNAKATEQLSPAD